MSNTTTQIGRASGYDAKPDSGAILFLTNALGIGGSERKTVSLVNYLHQRLRNVHLAYLDARTPLLKSISGDVPVTYLNRKGKISYSAIVTLYRYVREKHITRFVCVGLYPFLYAKLVRILLPRSAKPAVVLLVNRTEHAGKKEQRQMFLYRFLIRHAQKIIFGCHAQRKLWCERYRIDERRCRVIYNGIDEKKFSPGTCTDDSAIAALGIDRNHDEFTILAVGTLWANKNHVELVRLVDFLRNVVPRVRLVIAGEGRERARIESMSASHGLSARVALVGEVEDVRPLLEIADVYILPSISETFSNSTLEAMAMEKPVIVSNTGGMPEMIVDGVDGFLYERGDIQYLATLVERLAADPELANRIGRNARMSLLKRFTFSRMAREYYDVLGELCQTETVKLPQNRDGH